MTILAVIVSDIIRPGFLRISLELHRVQIPWRARSATIRGSGCGAPSGGPEDRAPCGSSKGKASAPEAECLFVFVCPKEAANLPHY